MSNASEFLGKHSLLPQSVDPRQCSVKMADHMRSGLEGRIIDMPMIPTYLKGIGSVVPGRNAIVIDAGGTNYRTALAAFSPEGCHITGLKVCRMPGTIKPVTWDEFISFVADSIMPFTDYSDVIGFCFSYNADITPDMDGIVHRIDKEVVITGCEEQRIGRSLLAELERRGVQGKKVVILNDTVAALLGGSVNLDQEKYSDFIGMICGTGLNTCASVSASQITKLQGSFTGKMLINLESGTYSGIPAGDVDATVDEHSHNPGEKLMEKMCSGAYIGEVCHTAFRFAAAEGYIPVEVLTRMDAIPHFDGAVVDSLACGHDPFSLFDTEEEQLFAKDVALSLFERSARCAAANILAILRINDTGKTPEKPACVCAEGSLIARSKYFLSFLQKALKEVEEGPDARYVEIVLGQDTTLPGSAVAALLNT